MKNQKLKGASDRKNALTNRKLLHFLQGDKIIYRCEFHRKSSIEKFLATLVVCLIENV